jgi:hypothetical protein
MPCHLLFIFTLSQGPTARDLRAAVRNRLWHQVPGGRHDAGEGHRYAASSLDAPTWPRYLSDARASEIAASSSSRVKGLKRTAMAFARRVNSRVVSSRWPVIIITGSRHPNTARVSQSWTPFISGTCTSTIKQASFFGSSLSRTARGRSNAMTRNPAYSISLRIARRTDESSSTRIKAGFASVTKKQFVSEGALVAITPAPRSA